MCTHNIYAERETHTDTLAKMTNLQSSWQTHFFVVRGFLILPSLSPQLVHRIEWSLIFVLRFLKSKSLLAQPRYSTRSFSNKQMSIVCMNWSSCKSLQHHLDKQSIVSCLINFASLNQFDLAMMKWNDLAISVNKKTRFINITSCPQ